MPRELYLLDSAHHGISMNPEGTRLCVAGTMSDYAAIVAARHVCVQAIHGGSKPYWSTNSADGRYCFLSWSGDDKISAISYKTGAEVAQVPVGDHPQRMRIGNVTRAWLQARQ